MIHTTCTCCGRGLLTSDPEKRICYDCESRGHTTPCQNKAMENCKHPSRIGDNYGESCQDCGTQLSGYGYGGFFGQRILGLETCIHLFAPMENDTICIYCEEWKSNLEGGDS